MALFSQTLAKLGRGGLSLGEDPGRHRHVKLALRDLLGCAFLARAPIQGSADPVVSEPSRVTGVPFPLQPCMLRSQQSHRNIWIRSPGYPLYAPRKHPFQVRAFHVVLLLERAEQQSNRADAQKVVYMDNHRDTPLPVPIDRRMQPASLHADHLPLRHVPHCMWGIHVAPHTWPSPTCPCSFHFLTWGPAWATRCACSASWNRT